VDGIRDIQREELDDFMRIVLNAYPRLAMPLEQEALGFEERVRRAYTDPSLSYIGFYRDNAMQGVMRCHDLQMNFHGKMIPVGGMGLLAVDLLHKKEHVAMKLMQHYHSRYREKNNCITIIYPFSTFFYRRMGYGYGSRMDQYRINPLGLPEGGNKQNLRYLTPEDADAVRRCHERVCSRTHGMCAKAQYEIHTMLHTPGLVPVAYVEDGVVKGYVVFHFQRGFEPRIGVENRYINDMYVHEIAYEDRESLYGLVSFMRTQADQIGRIVLRTQDEYFHHLLLDVSDGSQNIINLLYHQSNVSGVGVMYRVVDVKETFSLMGELEYGPGSCTVELNIQDSFMPENAGSYTLSLDQGRLKFDDASQPDVSLTMDISDFSSLLMGVVPLRRLVSYGYAELSDTGFLHTLDRLFTSTEKPVCYTGF
jgi:predicted acetyltransferase